MARPFDNYPSKSRKNSANPDPTSEIIAVMIHLTNPLARLSRSEKRGNAISALAELLWYFTGDNRTDFISHYIHPYRKFDENGAIYGGYGPRIFKHQGKYNQLSNVIRLLSENPDTRKAVIQIFDGRDIVDKHEDIPCTCTIQFLLRSGKLNMVVYMRSNDAYIGLPHDIFAFTMLQEMVSRALGVEIGGYFHSVGSLHLYKKNQKDVKEYLNEGHQSSLSPMPSMPSGNTLVEIKKLLDFESKVRSNRFQLI